MTPKHKTRFTLIGILNIAFGVTVLFSKVVTGYFWFNYPRNVLESFMRANVPRFEMAHGIATLVSLGLGLALIGAGIGLVAAEPAARKVAGRWRRYRWPRRRSCSFIAFLSLCQR